MLVGLVSLSAVLRGFPLTFLHLGRIAQVSGLVHDSRTGTLRGSGGALDPRAGASISLCVSAPRDLV